MPAPDPIRQLVSRFQDNLESYRSPRYNETQARREFIDPFFGALGWDIDNRQGLAEAYKDVIHEDSLEVEGATKAPDYAFRIGGARKFFVEAKKPFVRLETDIHPAFQLRRYAWSAKLPLSVLTDFEEFAVYDSRFRPDKTDKASTGRVALYHYPDYVEKWDEIAGIFSKDAVLRGSFDKYAEGLKVRKGTAEVDDAFLVEIERWREWLAKNIALRNPGLSVQELNYAVQMTIDRIVFLRICEDRGIEPYEQLRAAARQPDVYAELLRLFQTADARYDSGLFHFREERGRSTAADALSTRLHIDNKPLQDILKSLYFPDSPYVFSEIPPDILGQVYEQFLGKVIRLTAGGHARVEEKPEVRKAGGVYYTPTYIVDYIVRNTLGRLLEGKTPREAARLKVLDPACGSGTFLIGAYQYLLDWHLKWYSENDPAAWSKGRSPAIFRGSDDWQLTLSKKREILLNNIFAVDIDPQAVEVAKLSLLLKVVQSPGQLDFIGERILPDLGKNIQCGNSLIGPDYFEGRMLVDEDERRRVNPFDWQAAFPQVFAQGGFDVVMGNPPYIRIHNLVDFHPDEVKFIQTHFSTAHFGKVDIYVAFIEKAMQVLNGRGQLGFIVPNKFMQADYGVGLRTLLDAGKSLTELVDFGNAQVFQGATTYTCLLFLSKLPSSTTRAKFNKSNELPAVFLQDAPLEDRREPYGVSAWKVASSLETELLRRIEKDTKRLSEVMEIAITGVKTGSNSTFVFELLRRDGRTALLRPEDTLEEVELERKYLAPYLKAESLKRYKIGEGSRVILYPYRLLGEHTVLIPEGEIQECPRTWRYLLEHKRILEERQKGKLKGSNWYGLSFSSSIRMFSARKIVTPTLAPTNCFALDTQGMLFPQGAGGGCGLVPKAEYSAPYVLGLLNSRLLTFFFQRISSPFQGGWFAYEPRYLSRLPLRVLDYSVPADKARHDRMVALVERMLALHRQSPRTPQEQEALARQIRDTDREIDQLVYELYGLTEDEIRIVEGEQERPR